MLRCYLICRTSRSNSTRSKIDGWLNMSKVDGKIVGIKGHWGLNDEFIILQTTKLQPTSTKLTDGQGPTKSMKIDCRSRLMGSQKVQLRESQGENSRLTQSKDN